MIARSDSLLNHRVNVVVLKRTVNAWDDKENAFGLWIRRIADYIVADNTTLAALRTHLVCNMFWHFFKRDEDA